MHTCYVIDDEYHAIETLEGYIKRHPGLDLAGSSIDPLRAVDEITNSKPVDIVFLDVDMPGLSGLDVADIISPHAAVIFTTAYPNYAVQAFEKNGSDFILKPISFERFAKSVSKVQNLIKLKKTAERLPENDHFFINPGVKGRMIQLNYSDITYIEGLKNFSVFHTVDNKYVTYLSMTEIEKAIPLSRFVRIHKSYIVNIQMIRSINGNNVVLPGIEIHIGSLFKENFTHIINGMSLRSLRRGG